MSFTIAGHVAFQASPWPSVLIIRKVFGDTAAKLNNALRRHVPSDVSSILNERYDDNDDDAYLDVYFPSEAVTAGKTFPIVVWVHGGACVAGSKEEYSNYYKILAGKGYAVAVVDYSLAPSGIYPAPLRQVMAALVFLRKNAKRFYIDLSRFFLAGDSAGSHIVAQVANIICSPSYARLVGVEPSMTRAELSGVILYCGYYDLESAGLKGPFAGFFNTVLWAYYGTKEFRKDNSFKSASVVNYITPEFPATFISVGNGDPLRKQSFLFAGKAAALGVFVDSLFFPNDRAPFLPHEYQFNLDTEAGRLALERSVRFLSARIHP